MKKNLVYLASTLLQGWGLLKSIQHLAPRDISKPLKRFSLSITFLFVSLVRCLFLSLSFFLFLSLSFSFFLSLPLSSSLFILCLFVISSVVSVPLHFCQRLAPFCILHFFCMTMLSFLYLFQFLFC
jgi:hypothetical protein